MHTSCAKFLPIIPRLVVEFHPPALSSISNKKQSNGCYCLWLQGVSCIFFRFPEFPGRWWRPQRDNKYKFPREHSLQPETRSPKHLYRMDLRSRHSRILITLYFFLWCSVLISLALAVVKYPCSESLTQAHKLHSSIIVTRSYDFFCSILHVIHLCTFIHFFTCIDLFDVHSFTVLFTYSDLSPTI